jgi:purine nucleosidase
MMKAAWMFCCALCGIVIAGWVPACGQEPATLLAREKVIIDTDIGDDVDDAFALALALRSPELEILGVTTTFGDTETRAKIVDRLLAEAGQPDIPVAAGLPTANKNALTQRRYATGGHAMKTSHPPAVDFLLDQIKRHPGQITLIAIGPLLNVGAAIDKDASTFRRLKRVVLMGGRSTEVTGTSDTQLCTGRTRNGTSPTTFRRHRSFLPLEFRWRSCPWTLPS